MKFSIELLIFFVINLDQMKCYNVLIVLPFASVSHKNIFDPIAEKLVQNGHQVTLASPFDVHTEIKGLRNIFFDNNLPILQGSNFNFFKGSISSPLVMKTLMDLIFDIRDATFNNSEFKKIWKNPRSTNPFDLLVIDCVFNEFMLPLAYHWGIPAIYISPGIMYTPIAWNLNIPFPLSYLSTGLNNIVDPGMDLLQRTSNFLSHWSFLFLRNWYLFPEHDRFFQSIFPILTPPLIELERNVSFMITHTHSALFPSAPSMPYTAEIACVHCRPGKELPKDLQDYFNHSGDPGVIYFSLGSYTLGESMPINMREKIMAAFAKLPQKILWKYEKSIENLPSNIKLAQWVPQQDVLAHPKLRLFITHGGGLSTLEASYHGCPILGFPLSADQLSNMACAQASGFAESLDWKTFTTESLVDKIHIMLAVKRYKNKAVLLSKTLKDQPQSPVERAVYWIEYVIRHKGASHLKSSAGELNFFQYFLLDVIAVLGVIVVVVVWLLYYILKACLNLIISPLLQPMKIKSD